MTDVSIYTDETFEDAYDDEYTEEDEIFEDVYDDEDMIAATLGMQVFLLTDSLINKNDKDISKYPHGGFDELWKYLNI